VAGKQAKWRRRALEILLFVLVVAGIRAWQQRDMPEGAAPPLQGATLNGLTYALPAHPEKPVLVHFWATWCPICRTDQGTIDSIARDYPNTITVAMQSGSRMEVADHLRKQGLGFAVLNDPDGRISHEWGVNAVPASFIISKDGKIRFIEVGYTTGIGLRLRLWIASL
jgi:thiol-disulfide isomerase/thioredoxin